MVDIDKEQLIRYFVTTLNKVENLKRANNGKDVYTLLINFYATMITDFTQETFTNKIFSTVQEDQLLTTVCDGIGLFNEVYAYDSKNLNENLMDSDSDNDSDDNDDNDDSDDSDDNGDENNNKNNDKKRKLESITPTICPRPLMNPPTNPPSNNSNSDATESSDLSDLSDLSDSSDSSECSDIIQSSKRRKKQTIQ